MKRTLLFDFDGTIADSLESFIEIIHVLSRKHSLPELSREELELLRHEEPRAIIKRLNIPFYKIPLLARDMKKMQQNYIPDIKPFPGLSDILYQLKKDNFTLGIITSNGTENVEMFLKDNNVDVFDFIYSDSSLFGKDKVINKCLKERALSTKDVLYIGDEIRDIQACKKVGVKIIAVTWGLNAKEGLKKHDPDYLIDTPQELREVLR